MKELLEKTGIPSKNKGDGLSSQELNIINSRINDEVDICNSYLRNFCNVNQEMGDDNYTIRMSLSEALKAIPESRRLPGMSIKFLTDSGKFVEMVYCGEDVEGWELTENWAPIVSRIDGGEW